MPLKWKKPGTTVWTQPANGDIFVQWGNVWHGAGLIKVKANGAWQDSDYRGVPNPPTAVAIQAWDYLTVRVKWVAPTTGPTPTAYKLALRNASGAGISGQPDFTEAASPQEVANAYDVKEDTKYQIFVASMFGTLQSAWSVPLQFAIGHPAAPKYGYVTRTRAWSSPTVSGSHNKDDDFVVAVPSTVTLNAMHWRNMRTPQSAVVTPGTNRTVNWIFNGGDFGPINGDMGTVLSGDNTDWPFTNQGNGANWGVVPRGTGWSTTGNPTYQLALDSLWMTGSEEYQSYEQIGTYPAVANSYW